MKPCKKCEQVIDLHNAPICGFCLHKEKNPIENFDEDFDEDFDDEDFDFEKAMQEYDDELENFDDDENSF